MNSIEVNGIRLAYELSGTEGEALVFVHGGWGSHRGWGFVVPELATSFRVLTYDRRSHGDSERPPGARNIDEDVADLAALIEQLDLAPTWVIGNSFGASITIRLAGERPDLLRGIIVHEPPFLSLLAEDPALAGVADDVWQLIRSTADRVSAGDHAGAAEAFVTEVAGPDIWAVMPAELKEPVIQNAPAFLAETEDREQLHFDPDSIDGYTKPALLTVGRTSPDWLQAIVPKLARVMPHAEMLTFEDAGHVPQFTHPDVFTETIVDFVRKHS